LGLSLGVLLDQGAGGVLRLLQTLAQIKDGTARFIVSAKQGRLRGAGQDGQDKAQRHGGTVQARSNVLHIRPQ
jgi:hypothetical protein